MITVNNRTFPYQEGMTVQDVLDQCRYTFAGLVIRINDTVVEDHDHLICDGDDIKVIHICHGG